jgi:hypothetical protein
MKRTIARLACLALALVLAPAAARADYILDPGPPPSGVATAAGVDPVVFTNLAFTITNPAGTTVSGFTLTYTAAVGSITGLTLLQGMATTFTTNGINEVDASFPATSVDAFAWTFNASGPFPVGAVNLDFTGQSAPVTGAIVALSVAPAVAEPAAIVLFGTGLTGALALARLRGRAPARTAA